MGLATHPQLLEHARRRRVPSLQPPDDTVQPQILEGQPEHHPRSFRRVPPTVVVGMDDEADLALAVLVAEEVEVALADQLGRRLRHHGEREGVAL